MQKLSHTFNTGTNSEPHFPIRWFSSDALCSLERRATHSLIRPKQTWVNTLRREQQARPRRGASDNRARLQIADLSQRVSLRREKNWGPSDRGEWQWPGGLCLGHPSPDPPPPTFVPTPDPLLSTLAIPLSTGFVWCWIHAGRGEAGADPCRWADPLLLLWWIHCGSTAATVADLPPVSIE